MSAPNECGPRWPEPLSYHPSPPVSLIFSNLLTLLLVRGLPDVSGVVYGG